MRSEWKKEQDKVRRNEKSLVIARRDFSRSFNYIAGEYKPESCKPQDIAESRLLRFSRSQRCPCAQITPNAWTCCGSWC